MRGALMLSLLLAGLAATWALSPSANARAAIEHLDRGVGNPAEELQLLRRSAPYAGRALDEGLLAHNPRVRLACARELALRNSPAGDRELFRLLALQGAPGDDAVASAAESALLDAWARRDGPPPEIAHLLLRTEVQDEEVEKRIAALNQALNQHTFWAAGYIHRARLHILADRPNAARYDALEALSIQPDNFEGLVELARAWSYLDMPEQAQYCLDRALQLNPRLRPRLKEDLDAVKESIESQRRRERRDKRRRQPVA